MSTDGISLKSGGTKLRVNVQDWWKESLESYAGSGMWESEMSESWDKERNPETGEKWLPLAKERKGGKILRKTGEMLDSARILPSAKGLEVATTDYGVYHQKGTDRIPERQWAGLSNKSLSDIADIAIEKIFKEFN